MTAAITELCATLLGVLEGEALKAYQDSGGVWTIGFGHTAGVTAGMTCTHEEAAAWLAEDAAPLFAELEGRRALEVAAYVSFGYNCGAGALARVLTGKDTISNPVHTTDRHGVVLGGLVKRRRLELAMIGAANG